MKKGKPKTQVREVSFRYSQSQSPAKSKSILLHPTFISLRNGRVSTKKIDGELPDDATSELKLFSILFAIAPGNPRNGFLSNLEMMSALLVLVSTFSFTQR